MSSLCVIHVCFYKPLGISEEPFLEYHTKSSKHPRLLFTNYLELVRYHLGVLIVHVHRIILKLNPAVSDKTSYNNRRHYFVSLGRCVSATTMDGETQPSNTGNNTGTGEYTKYTTELWYNGTRLNQIQHLTLFLRNPCVSIDQHSNFFSMFSRVYSRKNVQQL